MGAKANIEKFIPQLIKLSEENETEDKEIRSNFLIILIKKTSSNKLLVAKAVKILLFRVQIKKDTDNLSRAQKFP